MDRPITESFRRRVLLRRAATITAVLVVVSGLFVFAKAYIRPSADRARVRIEPVTSGPIEATISATGLVEPAFEQVLSSPISTRVLKVLKHPGDQVRAGDPILELDVTASELDVAKFDQQLALKRNQIEATRLALQKTLTNLQSQVDIKALELSSFESKTAQQRQLAERGVVSETMVRQAELDERTARIQLEQLRKTMETERQAARTTVEGLGLELATLQSERAEAQKVLTLATTRADRDGVLTWVVEEEGSTVQQGAVLARIADLSRFRVKATVSDVHSERLSVGLPVRIRVNDQWLAGVVSNVLPKVENGTVAAELALDEPSNPLLRSNLRVDVLLVTERREQALRIAKGPFASAAGTLQVFVVRGETAYRVPARLGISDFDNYEVIEGLSEGDQVIVSDTSAFEHAAEVRLQ